MFNLGNAYANGSAPKNKVRALEWWHKAAEVATAKPRTPSATSSSSRPPNQEKAVEHWTKAARAGTAPRRLPSTSSSR